ncbi:MAG: hypothetical protein L6R35_006696 [Caloplaca aegaea]|nr:MAG: hypothetical protein L6R35_006696 [Caloplaca aegaea]
MTNAMESCPGKTVMSGVMGFALGGAFGLFMSSMSYDTPVSPHGQQLPDLPLKDQLRRGFRDMGNRSYSSAKNFGYRAKSDWKNGVSAGCVTGGAIAAKAGPQAAAIGCVGFAAFSAAIDAFMRRQTD